MCRGSFENSRSVSRRPPFTCARVVVCVRSVVRVTTRGVSFNRSRDPDSTSHQVPVGDWAVCIRVGCPGSDGARRRTPLRVQRSPGTNCHSVETLTGTFPEVWSSVPFRSYLRQTFRDRPGSCPTPTGERLCTDVVVYDQ